MSGVSGSNRISREHFAAVLDAFSASLAARMPEFRRAVPTGSFVSDPSKADFGDMDLILQFETQRDKKALSTALIQCLTAMPDALIVPFPSGKFAGRKVYRIGEIIMVAFPQPEGLVQIDTFPSTSPDEVHFKQQLLNMPAEKIGLIYALVQEVRPEDVAGSVSAEERLQYSLSTAGLRLRAVQRDRPHSRSGRRLLHETQRWDDVLALLPDYDLDGSFAQLLEQVPVQSLSAETRARMVQHFLRRVSPVREESPKGERVRQAMHRMATTFA